jgi:hypothetical protein
MADDKVSSHVYVVGEKVEHGCGLRPVKIGMHDGPASGAGAPGISRGNWRELEVLHRMHVPFPDLRWTEWLIHRRLWSRHVRGEWFDVRNLVKGDDWGAFLQAVLTNSIPGLDEWRLGNDGHELERVRRITSRNEPRQFAAICRCGEMVSGPMPSAFSTAQIRFAIDHLGLPPKHADVLSLKQQVHQKRAAND